MNNPRVRDIKLAQREKLLLRAIADLFLQAAHDDPHLKGVAVSRVELSPDKSLCTVFFYSPQGQEVFQKEQLDTLKLYKPSLRAALAKRLESRYTPDLIFKFDVLFDKLQRMESILESLHTQEDEQ